MDSLQRYSKMSKHIGKTVLVMVRGDLVAHATVDTDEIEYRDVGDLILSNLNEAIKDKEK